MIHCSVCSDVAPLRPKHIPVVLLVYKMIYCTMLTQTMPLDLMCERDYSIPAEWH